MLGKSDIPLDRIPAANSICSHVSSGIIAGSGAGKVRKFYDFCTILVWVILYDPITILNEFSMILVWSQYDLSTILNVFCTILIHGH